MRPLLPLLFLCACLLPTEAPDTGKPDDTDPAAGTCPYFTDADGDGFGDPDAPVQGDCEEPADGLSVTSDDCDDDNALSFPEAPESCDSADNDCDGAVDEEVEAPPPWFADADGDGYGDPVDPVLSCDNPGDRVDNGDDCDDTNPDINPDAEEVCDEVDNDCDGQADDESASDPTTWYEDIDSDGFGDDGSVAVACSPPPGNWVEQGGDCDDTAPNVNPDQSLYFQTAQNGSFDYNCDGYEVQEYPDAGSCDDSSGSCVATEGFYPTVPDCGGGALWLRGCDASCLPRTSGENLIQRCQ